MIPGDNESQEAKDQAQVEARYRTLEQDQPGAMLDQAVLNKARRAVESRPVRPWNFGWMHATATAAVLVLGLTLVLQHRSEVINPGSETRSNVPLKTAPAVAVPQTKENDFLENAADQDSRENEEFPVLSRQAAPKIKTPKPEQDSAQAEALGAVSADKKALSKKARLDQPAPVSGDPLGERAPDDWITTILELKRSGQGDTWQKELELFRQVFPNYPLPEELGG